ncbi:MAG: flagellar basal body L-ring protein FlgH [Desulfarculales bacterium]|jgi:flagellar L-ring protein precursor FlgH|nr:flagellar basal body L-ring protein FlgH [Desulfarculales bacterium]
MRQLISARLSAAIFAAFILSGCGGAGSNSFNGNQQIDPPPSPQNAMRLPANQPGSLYTSYQPDYFSDIRAHHVGDIIVVEIVENSRAAKTNDSKAERTSEFRAGMPVLMGYESSLIPNYNATARVLLGADTSSTFDAKAELTKEDSMTAAIGCTVMEVFPNGNLMIRGQREIQVNGETQFIYLTGTIRSSDVDSNNTVMSTKLADARIEYSGRGVLSDKQKPGWLTRLLDHIWPF